MAIAVRRVTKRFGDFTALDNVSLAIPGGSLTALLGPSGSGKSTLLRIIAGLETPDAGRVSILGEDVTGIPPQKREVGFVFQHYALFRHMTISENIGYGLKVRGVPKPERQKRVDELLHLIRLEGLIDRYPSQLSGGQRQRMALARALAVEPTVLLLDEPFGALDAKVRKELRDWLRRLHDEVHVTTVFENVAFGLRVRPPRERPTGREIASAVKDLLQLVELDALGGRYPSELSGGQQQRVALARALAVQPRVLLLDEPFGALDARVRKQLRQWLRQLHDEVRVTTILVTHDSEEACEVADRVAVMHEGRIAQIGTAAELSLGSANPFLESFLAESTRKSGGTTKINYH